MALNLMNKNTFRILIVGCIMLSFTCCHNNTEYYMLNFKSIDIVHGDTIIKDILCTNIWRMDVVDSLFAMHELHG